MQTRQVGFEASFRRHLSTEQRRAVLELLASDLTPEATLGEIVDAAEALGWSSGMGELSLDELATALSSRSDMQPQPEPEVTPLGRKRVKATSARGGKAKKKPMAAKVEAAGKFDERMSTEDAAAAFLPLIESLGQATMGQLEDETGIGRRKLRFHVGQLVRHGYLTRHGMGRGTYYTVA